MNRITINGSNNYDVLVESDSLCRISEILRSEIGGLKALVVSDSNVAALYLKAVSDSLEAAGYEVHALTFPAGDHSKSLDNYTIIQDTLSKFSFERSDVLIALGGGMIGDLGGFAAATFKRGIKLVHIPTTLLAAVDSSIGGKTAINFNGSKNQLGCFYNPSLVICDPFALRTLPDDILRDAYAEIIKYGILSDVEILSLLELTQSDFSIYTDIIKRSISVKQSYIEQDEQDNGHRQYLNLGHLVGHAIEAASKFSISHGQAVALGLAIEARACAAAGWTSESTAEEIVSLLEQYDFGHIAGLLPGEHLCIEDLAPYLASDKRLRNNTINIITPIKLGECTMRALPFAELPNFISAAL